MSGISLLTSVLARVVAWAAPNEDGDIAMVFTDRDEAATYCDGDEPVALIRLSDAEQQRSADLEAMRMALEALKEAKFVLDFATAAMIVPADADGPVAQIPAAIKALEQRVGES